MTKSWNNEKYGISVSAYVDMVTLIHAIYALAITAKKKNVAPYMITKLREAADILESTMKGE